MKKALLIFLFPLLSMGQTQIGADIDGEVAYTGSGRSISLSKDGSTLAIGAPANTGVIGAPSKIGSVTVFKNISGIWTQIGGKINGDAIYEYYGSSVSLSSDGSILAIGAIWGGNGKGLVRVFQNISDTWTQIGSDIEGKESGEVSGSCISLSSDGSILAIGAYLNDENGVSAGSVRVYKNISGNWTQIGTNINGKVAGEIFGYSVSLSNDGFTLAIGAPDNAGNSNSKGLVRVYQNISGTWTQIGADIVGEVGSDHIGRSVSLSSDGSTLAIGAPSSGNSNAGSVRVYKNVSGIWTKIGGNIYGKSAGYLSGYSVSLSSDGSTVAIGAPSYDISGTGSVRVYKNVSDAWTKIGVDMNGEAVKDWFGSSVSLSSDGSKLAIGAEQNDGNGEASGSVRVYDLSTILSSDSFVLANFSVYPNPASEVVTISLQEGLTLEKVNVYNTLGQLVKTENKNVIVVNSLAKGSYFFEVITNKGKAAKQIIVQ